MSAAMASPVSADRAGLETKIGQLRRELATLEAQLEGLTTQEQEARRPRTLPLQLEEYRRYGRQMILPGFGLPAQVRLKDAKVLVIGAGGLGCPLLLYLAGAGIGHITVVDSDTVELSNLHRQVLHSQSRIGMSKVESAKLGMLSLNSGIDVNVVNERFTRSLAVPSHQGKTTIDIGSFDLLVDCTDNAKTRYLLSDLSVEFGVTLVSGGAVGLEGWAGVWNLPAPPASEGFTVVSDSRGPCLRCIYPQSPQDNSGNCEDDGILGTVVGTIGTLMASEVIKLLVGLHDLKPSMTLFSPMSSPMFRTVKLRGRKSGCPGCDSGGARPPSAATQEDAAEGAFCGVEEMPDDSRISAKALDALLMAGKPHVLIDTRPEIEFGICSLTGAHNIPHTTIQRDKVTALQHLDLKADAEILVLCRQGNDSLLDARTIKQHLHTIGNNSNTVRDVRGGIRAWHEVHPEFPLY